MKCQAKKLSKNYNCNPFYLLQVRLTVPSFVFAVSIKPRFNVLSGFLKSAFTQFYSSLYWWVLINFVTQLLGLFTDRSNSFSYPFVYSKWNPYTFSYTSSLKKVLFSDGDSPPPPPLRRSRRPPSRVAGVGEDVKKGGGSFEFESCAGERKNEKRKWLKWAVSRIWLWIQSVGTDTKLSGK